MASAAGLDAQRIAIAAEAQRRAWTIVNWHAVEGISGGKGVEYRPGLAAAIHAVESGCAAGLLAAKLDRVSRSVLDTASLQFPHREDVALAKVIQAGIKIGAAGRRTADTVVGEDADGPSI